MSQLRIKADKASSLRCNTLIAVLENPNDIANVAAVVRNIDSLGVGKLYVIDGNKLLPERWESMRQDRLLNKISSSAIKWSYVKVFKTVEDCIEKLKKDKYVSLSTSPYTKGLSNMNLYNCKLTYKKLAIWFGNEVKGLSDMAINASIGCIQIEMAGIVESLNLAVSTGIVLYQAVQDRKSSINRYTSTSLLYTIFYWTRLSNKKYSIRGSLPPNLELV